MTNALTTWLERVPDTMSLSDISLPGTHDTATYVAGLPAFVIPAGIVGLVGLRGLKFVQCQSLAIDEQLAAGVRFLDLRIMPGERFPLYHGPVPLGFDLADALDTVDAFLARNSSETVVLSIKQETDKERGQTGEALRAFLKARARPPYLGNAVPQLGSVRGRAVVINRVFETADCGMFIWFDDNTTFSKAQAQPDGSTLSFAVQDAYNPSPGFFNSTLTAKKDAIVAAYDRFSTQTHAFRMNFLSGSSFPTRTPGEYADDINPRVGGMLHEHARGAGWITILDYVGEYGTGVEDPVAAIVSQNALTRNAAPGRDTLRTGEALSSGQSLVSSNHSYAASFDGDGDFVVRRIVDDCVLKAAGTGGADRAVLQDDGNFVCERGGRPLTSTGTEGRAGVRLTMQNDGNLVLYTARDEPVWASRTSDYRPHRG